jgi:glycosyltransferase involved in cell wall biosynthesis
MRLGLNLFAYYPDRHGGAEIYMRNIVCALAAAPASCDLVLFVREDTRGLYQPRGRRLEEVVLPTARDSRRLRLLEQLLLPRAVDRASVDVLFSNYVVPVSSRVPHIVNVHDLLYRDHPECVEPAGKLLYSRLFIPLSLRRAKRVLTVSLASAARLRSLFPWVSPKLAVTVEGVDDELATVHVGEDEVRSTLSALGISRPYLLSAATLGPNKNTARLLEAFQSVRSQCPELSLVLTGRRDQAGSLATRTTELGLREAVVFTDFVSRRALAALYLGATAHVMPSIYEGFGLSVIEAQHFGCPVACSNVTSLPEVAGGAALLFDPYDVRSISEALLALCTDAPLRATLAAAGRRNVERYTWERAAIDVLASAEGALGGTRPRAPAGRPHPLIVNTPRGAREG